MPQHSVAYAVFILTRCLLMTEMGVMKTQDWTVTDWMMTNETTTNEF